MATILTAGTPAPEFPPSCNARSGAFAQRTPGQARHSGLLPSGLEPGLW
jgi:hypothetical protein